jgi:hypothetical protein
MALPSTLCEAVTGNRDSQEILERLERANLFLNPLDDVRNWYRYHQLFADALNCDDADRRQLHPTYPVKPQSFQVQHTPCTVGSSSGRPDRPGGPYPFGWV